ncbi:MAG: hypothetical protein OCC45_02160 [Desulfotalea sp.]
MFGLFGSKKQDSNDRIKLSSEEMQVKKDFDAVKTHPGQITGQDFGRAFDFVENYPESEYAELLLNQMYAIGSEALKGLDYDSAVKVLDRMPDHSGADAIVRGMYKLEADYIKELTSPVIAYILQIIPDHPLAKELTTALGKKNITIAYNFILEHEENVYVEDTIRAMFKASPNVSLLLLQEKMDHPKVATIFEGIYGITSAEEIDSLTPNGVLFVLEIAPDHPEIGEMCKVLVEKNYIKAYEFLKDNPSFEKYDAMKSLLLKKKPSLAELL